MFIVEVLLRWQKTNLMWSEDILVPETENKVALQEVWIKANWIRKYNKSVSINMLKKELIKVLNVRKNKKGGKAMSTVNLKSLQLLAKEMQEGVGFDPPINYKEKDMDKLVIDIRNNANDLDAVQDKGAISDAGKKVLSALNIGPWLEEDKETESEEEPPVPKKGKASKKVKEKKTKEKKTKEKKVPVVTEKKKEKTAKKEIKKTVNKNKGIGVWVKEQLKKNKGVSNIVLAEKTKEKFPGAKTTAACISWYRARI